MPQSWVRILVTTDWKEIKCFWESILNECVTDALDRYPSMTKNKFISYVELDDFLKHFYAPFTFAGGRYDYIVPEFKIKDPDSAIEYITNRHKVFDPALAIVLNDLTVIGGMIPCLCDEPLCKVHRSKSCYDLEHLCN